MAQEYETELFYLTECASDVAMKTRRKPSAESMLVCSGSGTTSPAQSGTSWNGQVVGDRQLKQQKSAENMNSPARLWSPLLHPQVGQFNAASLMTNGRATMILCCDCDRHCLRCASANELLTHQPNLMPGGELLGLVILMTGLLHVGKSPERPVQVSLKEDAFSTPYGVADSNTSLCFYIYYLLFLPSNAQKYM